MSTEIRTFSLSQYVEAALALAEYGRDEDGVVVGEAPGISGFFAQGDSFEEARANMRDVIEGNVMLALQLGLPIAPVAGVLIDVTDWSVRNANQRANHN